jgi:hypothetical protein
MLHRLAVPVVLAAFLAGAGPAVRPAMANLGFVAADDTAWISVSARYALLTGPILCTAGELYEVELTLAQESSGAQSRGRTEGQCGSDVQRWSVQADVLEDHPSLRAGTGLACWRVEVWQPLSGGTQSRTGLQQGCGSIELRRIGQSG